MQNNISHRSLIIAVCVTQFFFPFMMAGVNSILPSIGQDTQASAKALSLVTTYYALGLAVFQLTAGRMGDIWGRRRVFLSGLTLFILMCITIGFVKNIYVMQVLRILQGAGGAMFSASGLAILAAAAPPGMRGRYIATSASAVYAGIACGPPVAGFITGLWGWPFVFWTSATAGLCAWFLMFFTVHEEWRPNKNDPFDWRGSMIYGTAMGILTLGSTLIHEVPWGSALLMLTGLGLIVVFAFIETRSHYPLLDVRLLFRNRVFALSSLAAFVNYSSAFGMLLFFSLYLQIVRGISVEYAGLLLTIQFIVQSIVAIWAGRMADKHDAGNISAIGIAVCGLGLCAGAFLGKDTSMVYFILSQICLGVGLGLFAVPNTAVIFESAGANHLGQAAGLTGAMRTSGALFNTIIISMTFGYFLGNTPVSTENIDSFLASMKVDLIFFGILNLIAIGCALSRRRSLKKSKEQ